VLQGENRFYGRASAGGRSQSCSWVFIWTIFGALVPGSGLIVAGRRRIGAAVLTLLVLAGSVLVAMAVLGDPVERVIALALDPTKLLILVGCVGLIALAWAAVIVLTNTQLRRHSVLSPGQQAVNSIVVLALLAGVGMPAYEIGHYALIQRDLVAAVFSSQGGNPGTTKARPDPQRSDPWADQLRINVLLIGSDAGADRTGIRPDTMILASINTQTGDTVLFSLPRNLERAPFPLGTGGNAAWPNGFYCPTTGTGHDCLLNAVWTWASGDGRRYYPNSKNPGLQATEDAIEGVTGLSTDTYAMLNLRGFAQFINAIGGLRVNVDERLPVGGNTENPAGTTSWIEKGRHRLLDGYQTLWFARSRWSTNDFDRMRRQRCVIGDVVNQADPVTLALAFPKIAQAAKNNLSTGIPRKDLSAWVELSQRVKRATVRSLPFTDQVISDRADPDFEQIHRLVAQALVPATEAGPAPPNTSPSPSARPFPTPTAGSTPTPTATSKAIDPTKAQNIKDVC